MGFQVTSKVKTLLEKSSLTGINNYKKVIYKKIVKLNWHEWDMNAEEPLIYPKGGSPENYILKNKHDENLIEVMPEIWLMEIDKKNELKKAWVLLDKHIKSSSPVAKNRDKNKNRE